MHEDLLTEAARRAIEAAAIISARNGATEREPMHLLWALILEESRAAEMLKESGVSRDRLRTVSPLELGESLAANPSGDEEREITESDAFRLVITKAVQAATLRGRASPRSAPTICSPV